MENHELLRVGRIFYMAIFSSVPLHPWKTWNPKVGGLGLECFWCFFSKGEHFSGSIICLSSGGVALDNPHFFLKQFQLSDEHDRTKWFGLIGNVLVRIQSTVTNSVVVVGGGR